jgi:hypothetical protein
VPLITIFPVTHPIGINPHLTYDIFDTVDSLDADTELWKIPRRGEGLIFLPYLLLGYKQQID